MRVGPHESSENNGYGNILALPFIGILGVAIVIIACLYPRRAPTELGAVKLLGFTVLYAITATVAYNLPVLYGGYTASFKLVDRNGDPISGMRVEFIQQRSDSPILISVFFVQDYATVDYSDKQGIVRAPANTNTRLSAFINLTPDDSTPVNPNYFIGDLLLVRQSTTPPTPSLTVSLYPSWEDQQDGQEVNGQVAIPFRDPVPITVPDRPLVSARTGK
jgi:hypothetical protein